MQLIYLFAPIYILATFLSTFGLLPIRDNFISLQFFFLFYTHGLYIYSQSLYLLMTLLSIHNTYRNHFIYSQPFFIYTHDSSIYSWYCNLLTALLSTPSRLFYSLFSRLVDLIVSLLIYDDFFLVPDSLPSSLPFETFAVVSSWGSVGECCLFVLLITVLPLRLGRGWGRGGGREWDGSGRWGKEG